MSAYRFVPRLRDLADRRLGTIEPPSAYKGSGAGDAGWAYRVTLLTS